MARDNISFTYFFRDSGVLILVALVLVIFLAAIVTLFCWDEVGSKSYKKNFYLALQGQKVNDAQAERDAKQVAGIIQSFNNRNDRAFFSNLRTLPPKSRNLLLGYNYKKIIDLVNGKKDIDLASSIKVPSWKRFFKWAGIIAWVGWVLIATIIFAAISWQDDLSLFDWPWKKWWVYPCIILAEPFLGLFMAGEAIHRIFRSSGLEMGRRERLWLAFSEDELKSRKDREDIKKQAQERIKKVRDNKLKTKEEFIKRESKDFKEEPVRLRGEIEEIRNNLTYLGQEITEAQRKLARKKAEMRKWEIVSEEKGEGFQKEHEKKFEQLWNLPAVDAFKVDGDHLVIYTKTIYINLIRWTYEIGFFEIRIDVYSDRIVGVRNLASTHPEGIDHPYGSGGYICWGKLEGTILGLLKTKSYAAAVAVMLEALQSAEGDSPFEVVKWKRVRKNKEGRRADDK